MKFTTRRIAFAGILAAIYATLTIAEGLLAPTLAYGDIQFRFAEALSVLCCFTPAAIPGMVIGCVVANLFSPEIGVLDVVFGSLATLLACLTTWWMSRSLDRKPWMMALIPLPTILFNALIVGAELALIVFKDVSQFPTMALFVGAGEAAVMYVLGLPLLLFLRRNKQLNHQLRVV